MPENNPFETQDLPEIIPSPNLTARERLFADMGLSPQGKPLETMLTDHDFLNADLERDTADDFITQTAPSPVQSTQAETMADEDDLIVDAIFTSTDTQEQSKFEVEELQAEHPSEDSVVEKFVAELHTASEQTVIPKSEAATAEERETGFELAPTELVTEPELQEEQPVLATTTPVIESETMSVLKSLDRAGFDSIVDAYTDLQQKLAANQALISAERESIAALRHQMRQLNALAHDMSETSVGLDQGRQLVQADSCESLIRSISQVNELIQQDSQRAMQLMAPIKAGVEVLELRVKHVSAIENLLAHMQAGLKLQEQLAGADTLIHGLAKHLGLNLTQA